MTYITRANSPSQAPARNAFSIPAQSVMHGTKPNIYRGPEKQQHIHITGYAQGLKDAARLSALRLSSI